MAILGMVDEYVMRSATVEKLAEVIDRVIRKSVVPEPPAKRAEAAFA